MNVLTIASLVRHCLTLAVSAAILGAPVTSFADSASNENKTVATGATEVQNAPSCSIEGSLSSVTVSLGPNGRAGDASAGSIVVACNTLQATVSISSSPMVNSGTIIASEDDLFTNSIAFSARAIGPAGTSGGQGNCNGAVNGGGVANCFGVVGNNEGEKGNSDKPRETGTGSSNNGGGASNGGTVGAAWEIVSRGGSSSRAVNAARMTLAVSAINFETLTKMPIAGKFVGRICVSVSPSGLDVGASNGSCRS